MNTLNVTDSNVVSATYVNSDFRVDANGEAYISQRKAAELLGVARDSLKSHLERNVCTHENGEKLELSQGLTSGAFAICTQYYALDARNPTEEAKTLLKQITAAGVKAYLYSQAGYVMSASLPSPEVSKPASEQLPVEVAVRDLKAYKEVLELLGVTGNSAILGANQAVTLHNGIDLLERVNHKHLIQPEQVQVLNVTDLGKRIGLKASAVNLKLEELLLQSKINGVWTLTDTGKEYGVLQDTSKRKGSGTPVLQLKWKVTVLDLF